MMTEDPRVVAERLRGEAVAAMQRAEAARALAIDLDRRRAAVLTRLDRSVASHTDAVWRSPAATRSRAALHDEVAFEVWAACTDLGEICRALEGQAAGFDEAAAAARRAAEVSEAEAVVAARRGR